jgi:acetyltransferase-like isoleucine patch superfamily enzyme
MGLKKQMDRLGRIWRNQRIRLERAGLNESNNSPFFRKYGVQIGDDCRIFSNNPSITFGSEPFLVKIGNHVTITQGVRFVTHDGGTWIFREEDPEFDAFAPIEVKDNCFIGLNSIILPGVTIGPNSVVGANSVVSRDVPPDSVAAGSPAKKLMSIEKYRAKKLLQRTVVHGLPPAERRRVLEKLWERHGKQD